MEQHHGHIYPPGCSVKLASGETAIVTHVGPSAHTPVVAALTNRHGDALGEPQRRDTAQPGHTVVQSVPEQSVKVRVTAEQLYRGQSLYRQ